MLSMIAHASSSVEISVINPEMNSQPITIEAEGVVTAKNTTVLTAKSSGIFQPFVHNNANIKKGDKIAKIIDERRIKKLKLLQSKLALQEIEIKSQTVKVSDTKEMYTMGVGSKNSYLNEKLLLEQLKESYHTIKNEYATLLLEEQNSHVYALQDGFITNLLSKNAYVDYQTQLATLLTKETSVKLFVDSAYAKNLHKNMQVILRSNYAQINGIVTDILNNSSNNLIEVMVKPDKPMPLNLHVNASIILKNVTGLKIPKDCVVLVDNHPAIYVIKDNIAHLVFVDIQKDMIQNVLIKNSLAKDTQIAYKNAYLLHDGLKVTVK